MNRDDEMSLPIAIDKDKIRDFCQRHGMKKLALFGSVLRDDFRPDSDVDALVEYYPGQVPDFFTLLETEEELSQILGGRKVDLVTEKFLHKLIRQKVMDHLEILFVE